MLSRKLNRKLGLWPAIFYHEKYINLTRSIKIKNQMCKAIIDWGDASNSPSGQSSLRLWYFSRTGHHKCSLINLLLGKTEGHHPIIKFIKLKRFLQRLQTQAVLDLFRKLALPPCNLLLQLSGASILSFKKNTANPSTSSLHGITTQLWIEHT